MIDDDRYGLHLITEVGEPPHIAKSNGVAKSWQEEIKLSRPGAPANDHIVMKIWRCPAIIEDQKDTRCIDVEDCEIQKYDEADISSL